MEILFPLTPTLVSVQLDIRVHGAGWTIVVTSIHVDVLDARKKEVRARDLQRRRAPGPDDGY